MKANSARPALALILTMTAAGCASTGGAGTSLYADYLSGRYAGLQRDSATATERYFNALRQDPGNTAFLDSAVESALTSGDATRAEAVARMAVRGGMESDLGRLTLAVLALRGGRFSEADQLTARAQGGAFDRLASRVLDGWALAGMGRADGAAAVMTQAGGGAIFKPLYDYQRAMILERAGRTSDALTAYTTARAGNFRLAAGAIRNGRLLESQGQKDEALTLYRAYLASGEDPTVRAELVRAESGAAAPANPIEPAEGAAVGLFALSSTLIGQADPDFYLPYLTLTSMLDPQLDVATILHAEGLRQIRQYAASRAQLEKVPATSPWFETARTRLAWVYQEEGKKDEALLAARDLVAQNNGRLARTTLADLERGAGHFTEAEALYDALIAEVKTPAASDWPLFYARGASRDQLGRTAEAEADLRHAIALSPDQAQVLNYLGYTWVDKGMNLDEAMTLLKKAVSLEPNSGYIIDSLGWAYYRLGDYQAALENLDRAVELDPEDATLNDHLGDVYWRLGRKVEARFQWERALSLEPDAKDRPQIETKLKNGLPDVAPVDVARPQAVRTAPR